VPRTDYSQVFQNTTAVERYEGVQYAADSQSSAVNRRQRRYIRALVSSSFGGQKPTQHDFACGTGRAVELLRGLVADAHGYDVSAQMIERAKAHGYPAHWHVVDATGPVPKPEPTTEPSIVTIFRLLLNVPDEVRERAIAFAAEALPTPESGLLVVQNHGSTRSLRHLSAGKHANNPWYSELSDARVYEIFAQHGFTLVERKGCAIFPRGWYRPKLTKPIVRRLDTLLCKTRIFDRYAVDVLYVARRSASVATPAAEG
jgi:SAM-dependent methyltransferase